MHMPEPDMQTRGELLIGTPEEKLSYEINHVNTVEDLRNLARGLDQLAQIYDDEHRYIEAEVGYLLSIEFLQRTPIKNDPELGLEYQRLAAHYAKVGDLALARKANLKSLTILRAHATDNPLLLAIVLHNQAWFEIRAGKIAKAEQYLLESLTMLKQKVGPKHFLVGLAANAIAELYMKQGNLSKSEEYFKMALENMPHSPETKVVTKEITSNYVSVLRKCHKYSAAKELEVQVHAN